MNRTNSNSRLSNAKQEEGEGEEGGYDPTRSAAVDFVNQTLGGPGHGTSMSMDGVLGTPGPSTTIGGGAARTGRTRSGTLTAGSMGAAGASTSNNGASTTTAGGSKVSKLTLRDQEKVCGDFEVFSSVAKRSTTAH